MHSFRKGQVIRRAEDICNSEIPKNGNWVLIEFVGTNAHAIVEAIDCGGEQHTIGSFSGSELSQYLQPERCWVLAEAQVGLRDLQLTIADTLV